MLYKLFSKLSEVFSPYDKEERALEIYQSFVNFFEKRLLNENVKTIDYSIVTGFKSIENKGILTVFVKTTRLGILIGRRGRDINALTEYMGNELNLKVEIKIEEDMTWNRIYFLSCYQDYFGE
jgi:ribosomal protein S3